MKQLHKDLWQSTVYDAGAYRSHAWLLATPRGNALIYGLAHERDLDAVDALGGASHQLLSHRDEAGPMLNVVRERLGSQLCASALEAPAIAADAALDIEWSPDDRAVRELPEIEIIHTPGHTDGSVCFFYRSPHGKSYLFPGDTFFRNEGRWSVFVIEQAGGSWADLARSLERLRGLEPDVVLCSAFVGDEGAVELQPGEWAAAIDARLERMRARQT